MADIIIVVILVAIVGSAIAYIVNAKKKGVRCVGCPDGGTCGKSADGCCNCGCGGNNSENS